MTSLRWTRHNDGERLKDIKIKRQKYEKTIKRTEKASRWIPMNLDELKMNWEELRQKYTVTERQKQRQKKKYEKTIEMPKIDTFDALSECQR